MGELHTLSEAQCRGLLTDASTGRVAVVAPDGPHIVPVNFALVDESLVFRTSPFTLLASYAEVGTIAFEVDHTDATTRTGWSVVARGRATVVRDSAELAHIRRVWEPMPWAAGERNLHLRLKYTELSGRSLSGLDAGPGRWFLSGA
ncbi:MAG: pyridoxamine 5'-phosphate oxidase family protein [Propionibacteriales bacterium]|nr:pyridoxamine 5'-phosphate oxidase family protein [Propionibacteriales bacterium]